MAEHGDGAANTGATTTPAEAPIYVAKEEPTVKSTPTPSREDFSLQVKQEYVLTERPACLGPLPETHETNNNADSNVVDSRDASPNNHNNGKRNKRKQRGQNKKRPRDIRQDDGEKLCMAVMRGDACPMEGNPEGKTCRFSHDLESFMKTRPEDITEVEGGCPNFTQFGYCMYGAMCRFGSSHITKSGQNVRKDVVSVGGGEGGVKSAGDDESEKQTPPPINNMFLGQHDAGIMNHLPRNVAIQLRKKQYPFKCRRHFEEEDEKYSKEPASTAATTTTNDTNEKDTEGVDSGKTNGAGSFTPLDKLRTKKLVDFSNKVYVAPLTTVGNLPFRRIMKGFGADITCGEMAVVPNLLQGQPSEWALLKRHPSEDVFGVQLAAAHPDQYTRVSELVDTYCEVDFVDLNLGCPLDILCNKGAGAALMMRDKKLKPILRGMSQTLTSACITVKMRTGWDMEKPFAHTLVPKIQSWGIDGLAAFMVHGRSRLQRYKLDANWEYISQVASSESATESPIPLIGNGDIFSYQDYKEKVLAHPNLSPTAMLGRGALIKPWLPTEIKEKRDWDISASERLDMLKSFVRYALEHWGSDQEGVNKSRRFLLEWLSFLHRYVPVGLLEVLPQKMNMRPPVHMMGRNDLETLFLSPHSADWLKVSEMLLGPVREDFRFEPKHKASGYVQNG